MSHRWQTSSSLVIGALAFAAGVSLSCGSAKELYTGTYLGPANLEEGSRTDGANLGNLYEVVQIVTATDGDFSSYANNEYPFTGARILFNNTTTDRQVPFTFTYSYPANNYKLNEAHIVVDTSRDTSDTEGIMVDGVFTGRVVTGILNANAASPKVEYRRYLCSDCAGGLVPGAPTNAFYMDWSLSHYKNGVINTFDLALSGLLPSSTKTMLNVVNDGKVEVVTGDDSPIYNGTGYEPKLFLKGVTISRTPLTCTTSPTYQFRNVYVHNDGNTIGQSAFTGAVTPKYSVDNAPAGFRSVGFYFDPRLPAVASTGDITITSASISLSVKRNATDPAAIVVNGVGVSEASFDRNNATSVVETWSDSSSATSYWSTFLASVPADGAFHTVTLDLTSLLGAGTVRDLIAQGKFNIEIAGSIHTVNASNNTSARTYAVIVTGPEFTITGTYVAQVCNVPDDPTSPLSDNNPDPPGVGDTTSPLVTSVQAINITSGSATIQWLTDEGADSQVGYGVGGITTATTLDSTMVFFHTVNLTGLQPYKYYYFEVRSADGNGNPTTYATKVFRTLR